MRSWCGGGGGGGGVVPLKVKLENYGKQREICWIKYIQMFIFMKQRDSFIFNNLPSKFL